MFFCRHDLDEDFTLKACHQILKTKNLIFVFKPQQPALHSESIPYYLINASR